MGIWDYISSTTDSIKRNAPDPTSLKSLYRSFYGYSHAAAEKLYPHLPDAETRSEIATIVAKQTATVAVREGAKLVPGGSLVHKIVSQSLSLSDNKTSKEELKENSGNMIYKAELEELKDKVSRLEREISDGKESVEQAETPQPTTKLHSKI